MIIFSLFDGLLLKRGISVFEKVLLSVIFFVSRMLKCEFGFPQKFFAKVNQNFVVISVCLIFLS